MSKNLFNNKVLNYLSAYNARFSLVTIDNSFLIPFTHQAPGMKTGRLALAESNDHWVGNKVFRKKIKLMFSIYLTYMFIIW